MAFSTTVAAAVSSASFLWYGAGLFRSRAMVVEFERYRLAPYRQLTGALQMAAGVGLIVGLRFHPMLVFCAGGLAAMTLGATIVRLRVRDPLRATIPALLLLGLNLFIVATAR